MRAVNVTSGDSRDGEGKKRFFPFEPQHHMIPRRRCTLLLDFPQGMERRTGPTSFTLNMGSPMGRPAAATQPSLFITFLGP